MLLVGEYMLVTFAGLYIDEGRGWQRGWSKFRRLPEALWRRKQGRQHETSWQHYVSLQYIQQLSPDDVESNQICLE